MKVAIVIPAYNEEATIEIVVSGVSHVGDVIVVDDSSDDKTAELAERAGATVVRHTSNRGYDGALQSGFERAEKIGVDAVITFDADGQHDPSVLDEIISKLDDTDVQLVLGVRPSGARFSEVIFNSWVRYKYGICDILCGLKGYRIGLYREHGCFDSSKSIGTELALSGLCRGYGYHVVPVSITERDGQARFGSLFKANMKILKAMMVAVFATCAITVDKK